MEFILPTRAGYVNHWKKRVAELQLTETQNLGGSRSGKKKKKKRPVKEPLFSSLAI